ncbi:MAG: hypothetical protein RIT81_19980 [Deltaproteobacteria bacterium]
MCAWALLAVVVSGCGDAPPTSASAAKREVDLAAAAGRAASELHVVQGAARGSVSTVASGRRHRVRGRIRTLER